MITFVLPGNRIAMQTFEHNVDRRSLACFKLCNSEARSAATGISATLHKKCFSTFPFAQQQKLALNQFHMYFSKQLFSGLSVLTNKTQDGHLSSV